MKWYVGNSYWDGLCWIPNKRIRVKGIGIYCLSSGGDVAFELGIKYKIEDASGKTI